LNRAHQTHYPFRQFKGFSVLPNFGVENDDADVVVTDGDGAAVAYDGAAAADD
jgi:hypothetical protein